MKRQLALLESRRGELETCAYCPKLCRAACPVSNAEARDTVTPWGKMSGTHAVGRGAAPATEEYATLPWACTGCFACRERCDHRNPVAETLYEARAEFVARGLAPEASERSRRGFQERLDRVRASVAEHSRRHELSSGAPVALVLGCQYALEFPQVVDDAIRSALVLFGPLRLVAECCGYSLECAGDPEGARAARERLTREVRGVRRLIVLDPGCSYALAASSAEPFSRAAEASLCAAHPDAGPAEPLFGEEPLRYHDPCLLGRGLGEYEAPRALIGRATPGGAREFFWRREHARCSGGGGLLPLTRPATSAAIARTRLEEHERLGGGTIVTACAQSLRRFRASGAKVMDLASVVARLLDS